MTGAPCPRIGPQRAASGARPPNRRSNAAAAAVAPGLGPGFRERFLADPSFLVKLGIEVRARPIIRTRARPAGAGAKRCVKKTVA